MPVMDKRAIERALNVRWDTYPDSTLCAVCGNEWRAHKGSVCPRCSLCGKHPSPIVLPAADRHPKLQKDPEVLILENQHPVPWFVCRGGVTTFLPDLGRGELFDGD